jgi:hypothetical protein
MSILKSPLFNEKSKLYMYFSLAVVLMYLLFNFQDGDNSYGTIKDSLDSWLPLTKIVAESGKIFAPNNTFIYNVMNGVPRQSFISELNLSVWLFYFFKPFIAFAIGKSLVHLMAWLGMYKLCIDYLSKDNHIISGLTAALFSMLLFWEMGWFNVTGIPLVVWAFLNLRNNVNLKASYWALIIIPFYSIIFLTYVYFFPLIGIVMISDFIKRKRISKHFIYGVIVFGLTLCFVEYRLLESIIIKNNYPPSNRDVFMAYNSSFLNSLQLSINGFLYGNYNAAPAFQFPFIMPIVTIGFFISLSNIKSNKNYIWLFILLLITCIWYGYYNWEIANRLKDKIIFLKISNFIRFFWLAAPIWYMLFAMALKRIWFIVLKNKNKTIYIKGFYVFIALVFLVQTEILFNNSEYNRGKHSEKIGFRAFYSEDLFKEIRDYIKTPPSKYRVVCFGFYPGIAQFNGFHTLDAYLSIYPLSYKLAFRKVISKELDKSADLKSFYDDWGNKVFLFSSELGKELTYTKNQNKVVNNLEIDTHQLRNMGCNYIFSSVEIRNYQQLNLSLLKTFEKDNSPWKIFIYQVS